MWMPGIYVGKSRGGAVSGCGPTVYGVRRQHVRCMSLLNVTAKYSQRAVVLR